MAFAKVTVEGPPNRKLYLNRMYGRRRGLTDASGVSVDPIRVEIGEALIETLDKNKKPDFAVRFVVKKNDPTLTVTLKRIT